MPKPAVLRFVPLLIAATHAVAPSINSTGDLDIARPVWSDDAVPDLEPGVPLKRQVYSKCSQRN